MDKLERKMEKVEWKWTVKPNWFAYLIWIVIVSLLVNMLYPEIYVLLYNRSKKYWQVHKAKILIYFFVSLKNKHIQQLVYFVYAPIVLNAIFCVQLTDWCN